MSEYFGCFCPKCSLEKAFTQHMRTNEQNTSRSKYRIHKQKFVQTDVCTHHLINVLFLIWCIFFYIVHTTRLHNGYDQKKRLISKCCVRWIWPPKSPDLFPSEMIWDELEHRVKAKYSTSVHHLEAKSIPGKWQVQNQVKCASEQI